jgi:hypothetical protein
MTFLTNLIRRLTILSVLSAACTIAQAGDPNADIYGQWKITDMIGMGAVASLSEAQSRQLIGKPLTINDEKYEFNGKVCSHPEFTRHQEEPRSYFSREWNTGIEGIPLPNPVTIIKTPGCDFLFPIRKDHLMIAEHGIFFEAKRQSVAPFEASAGSGSARAAK